MSSEYRKLGLDVWSLFISLVSNLATKNITKFLWFMPKALERKISHVFASQKQKIYALQNISL